MKGLFGMKRGRKSGRAEHRPSGLPNIERLETRRFFAVTVTQNYPGYYRVDSDNNPNAINISVSQNNDTFTLDGVTYPGVSYITVNGNGGNDTINVSSADGSYGPIGCAINGGWGNDTISMNVDGVIHGGAGDDTISLRDSFYGEVYGDSGNDKIYVSGDCIDPQIYGGTGNCLIDASQNNYGVVIHGGTGNDTLIGSAYDDTIYGDGGYDVMYGNGGNDTFYSTGGVIYGGSGGTNVAYVPTGMYVPVYNVQFVYAY